jgi:hypothetical protein
MKSDIGRKLAKSAPGESHINVKANDNDSKKGITRQDILDIRQSRCSTKEGYRKSQPIR